MTKSEKTACPKAAQTETPAGFSSSQLRKLLHPVDPRHVHTREIDGRQLSYIEGWYAVAQANAIFGYAGWDRQTVHFERTMERAQGDQFICGYIARVRITVRAGASSTVREGTGWGWAIARTSAGAHERALKSAETDATKRALSTFGPSFGLSLYDKDARNGAVTKSQGLTLLAPDGQTVADGLSPEGFSTGLRQLIEHCCTVAEIEKLKTHNAVAVAQLRIDAPLLRNAQGTHFADLLLKLLDKAHQKLTDALAVKTDIATEVVQSYQEDFRRYVGQSPRRKLCMAICPSPLSVVNTCSDVSEESNLQTLADREDSESMHSGPVSQTQDILVGGVDNSPAVIAGVFSPTGDAIGFGSSSGEPLKGEILAPSRIALGPRINKASLAIGYERRLRDKDHLRRVAQLPCLICSRQPSHAHHLRFAQRRGLSQKVSDEYVVPLCALHHGDLHRSSSEKDWWSRQKIDPMPVSVQLWDAHR